MTIEKKKDFLINFAFFIVICAIAYVAFKFLSVYLLPFVIGILASFLVQRPSRAIHQATRIPSGVCTVVLVVITYFLLIGLVGLIGFMLYRWVSALLVIIPEYFPTFSKAMKELSVTFSDLLNQLPSSTVSALNNMPEKIVSTLTGSLTSWLSAFAGNIVKRIPNILISIIITVVASCYIAKDYRRVIKFSSEVLPARVWQLLMDIKIIFMRNILRMLRGYALLLMITFIELSIGLLILRVDNSIALAAVIAVVDILPVLGTGTVLIPWAVIELITGNIWHAVGILIVYLVITVIHNFLEPKVIGNQVGLHPLITLIAIFCGYKLMGFVGLFLFPVTIIVLHDLYVQGKITIKGLTPAGQNADENVGQNSEPAAEQGAEPNGRPVTEQSAKPTAEQGAEQNTEQP